MLKMSKYLYSRLFRGALIWRAKVALQQTKRTYKANKTTMLATQTEPHINARGTTFKGHLRSSEVRQ